MSEGKNQTISVNEALNRNATNPASLDGQPDVHTKKKGGKKTVTPMVSERVQNEVVPKTTERAPALAQPVKEQEPAPAQPSRDTFDVVPDVNVAVEAGAIPTSDGSLWTPVVADDGAKILELLDGDTVELENAGGWKERLRLSNYDAPEKSQEYGSESTKALEKLLGGAKSVKIVRDGVDRYGRTTGRLIVDGEDVATRLIKSGDGQAYKTSGGSALPLYQKEAENNNLGMFGSGAPTEAPSEEHFLPKGN